MKLRQNFLRKSSSLPKLDEISSRRYKNKIDLSPKIQKSMRFGHKSPKLADLRESIDDLKLTSPCTSIHLTLPEIRTPTKVSFAKEDAVCDLNPGSVLRGIVSSEKFIR